MKYFQYQKLRYPIGSGVTKAACKEMVKQHLMKWNVPTVEKMLLLRGIACKDGKWSQFWR